MPPKRPRGPNAPDSQPTKRPRTRASTKSAHTTEPTQTSEHATPQASKQPQTKSKTKSKVSNSKSAKPEPKAGDADKPSNPTPKDAKPTDNQDAPTSLTITSPDVKNPISCQLYDTSAPSPHRTFIFTHGAGGTLSAPAVVNFCTGFSSSGFPSSGFPSSPALLAFQGSMNLAARVKAFRACITHVEDKRLNAEMIEDTRRKQGKKEQKGLSRMKLTLGGRSMGARAAVIAASEMLATDDEVRSLGSEKNEPMEVDLVLVSYPLQGPKDVRDQILLDLPKHVRVLFVIGSKDGMCPLELLNEVRGKMDAKSWLVVVEGVDHGMHGKGEKELGERSGKVAAEWVGGEGWDGEKVLKKED